MLEGGTIVNTRINSKFWDHLSLAWRSESLPFVSDYRKEDFIENITLSDEQFKIVMQNDEHMLINGSAGSGKSITLISKMIKTLNEEQEPQRVLYVSFGRTLVQDAKKRLNQSLLYKKSIKDHEVHINTFHYTISKLLNEIGITNIKNLSSNPEQIKNVEEKITARIHVIKLNAENEEAFIQLPKLFKTHTATFLKDEFLWMKANGYIDKEKYLECERNGRGNTPRLNAEQRETVFHLFNKYQESIKEKFHDDCDYEDHALYAIKYIEDIKKAGLGYDHVYADEIQDLQPMQLRALSLLAKKTLILSGDNRQRIYKRSPHSFKSLEIYIEGRRNQILRENYRSTKQIMQLANSLKFSDESVKEDRDKFIREYKKPEIIRGKKAEDMTKLIIRRIKNIFAEDAGSSIAVIHRYDDDGYELKNSSIKAMLEREFSLITTEQYGVKFDYNKSRKPVFFTDSFSVKGLEFDYVFVIHFDCFHYPHENEIKKLEESAGIAKKLKSTSYTKDLSDVLNNEKKVLYVAMTRAKQQLFLLFHHSKQEAISSFVKEFNLKDYEAIGFAKTKI